MQVTISKPSHYKAKTQLATLMVAFTVSGTPEALDAFRKDNINPATGKCSEDENGNPLFHINMKKAKAYGVKATLTQGTSPEGENYWFSEEVVANNLYKQSLDESEVAGYVASREQADRAFIAECSKNRSASIAKLQTKAKAETDKI